MELLGRGSGGVNYATGGQHALFYRLTLPVHYVPFPKPSENPGPGTTL